jgi:hypothetical protein
MKWDQVGRKPRKRTPGNQKSETQWGKQRDRLARIKAELVGKAFSYAKSAIVLHSGPFPEPSLQHPVESLTHFAPPATENGATKACFEAASYTPWILRDA